MFSIPLCPNELGILNLFRVCSIREIPASFDLAGTLPSLPGALSFAGDINKRRKSAVWTVSIANFRVSSVDKSCGKAIINYLRESNTKIAKNRRWSSTSGSDDMLSSRRAGQRYTALFAHLRYSGYFSL